MIETLRPGRSGLAAAVLVLIAAGCGPVPEGAEETETTPAELRAARPAGPGPEPGVDPGVAPGPVGPAPIVDPTPVPADQLLGMVTVRTWLGSCTGAVIAHDTVLTAAHCVCTDSSIGGNVCRREVTVEFRPDPDGGPSSPMAGDATFHPDFNPSWTDRQFENDLAVVKLAGQIPLHVKPFVLAEQNQASGSRVIVAGRGRTGSDCDGAAGVFNSDQTKIGGYEDSNKIIRFNDEVVCKGDSGGPVLDLSGEKLLGIHSMKTWTVWHGWVDKAIATPRYNAWIRGFLTPAPFVANDTCHTAPPRRRLAAPVVVGGLPSVPVDLMAPWNFGGTVALAHYPSTGSAFAGHSQWSIQGGWDDAARWAVGDFNRDGRSDLATVWNDGGRNTIAVRLSHGAGVTVATWATRQGWFRDTNQLLAGDFDEDGRDDLALVFDEAGQTSIAVFRSTGSGFESLRWWARRQGGWGDSVKWATGYFDGDRKADIAAIWNNGGSNTITVRASTGSSFVPTHWAFNAGGWADSTRWLAGDYNGDGLTDLAAAWQFGAQTAIAVYPSSGSNFPGWSQWLIQGGWIDSARWAVGDYNDDGRSDLAAIWNNGGSNTITVRASTGAAFTVAHWATGAGGWMDTTQWCAGRYRPRDPVLAGAL